MKKMLFGIAAAALVGATGLMADEAAAPAASEQKVLIPTIEFNANALIPSVNINLQYASAYMSDGKILNPESMLFGDLTLSWDVTANSGVYGGIWVANDWNDYNEGVKGDGFGGVQYEPEEIDYYVGAWYTIADLDVVKSLTFDLSYTYWDMPKRTGWNYPGNTKMKLTLDVKTGEFKFCDDKLGITPGIKFNNDFENDEWQIVPYVKGGFAVTEKLGVNSSLELFWENAKWFMGACNHMNDDWRYTDADKNGLATLVWSVDVNFAITDNVSFGPFGKLAWCLDHDYRETWKWNGNPNMKSGCNTLWGVQLNVAF